MGISSFFNCLPFSLVLQYYVNLIVDRGVAQLASALGSGPSGRRFKSVRPDHLFLHLYNE